MSPKTSIAFSFAASAALITTAALAAPVSEGGRKFTTELTGEAEVNAQGVPNQGDLDGTGTATVIVNAGQERVCWTIEVAGITLPASLAHIHVAPAGVNGPVVVTLSPPGADGKSSGCTSVPRELALEIIRQPANYYVNIHTSDFPAGALRGQLSRKP